MDNVLAQMQQDRGYLYATHEFLARHDPDFLAVYNKSSALSCCTSR